MCAKKATLSSSKNSSSPKKPVSPKTLAPSTKPKSAASDTNGALATSAAAKKTVSSKSAATATLAKAERTLSNHDIGQVAGEIWALLEAKDAQTVAAIKKSISAPADVASAAIGWLAREDKLEFATSGKTQKLSLKK
jgi:hypothetical protein